MNIPETLGEKVRSFLMTCEDEIVAVELYKRYNAYPDQQALIEQLKKELALACRSIERLCPPPMIGLVILADKSIFNLTSAKQLCGLDLATREPALAEAELFEGFI